MKVEEIVKKIERQFPGKKVINNNNSEIVCETDPKNGKAIAVIDRSIPHFHKKTIEHYKIIAGALELYVDDEKIELKPGDEYTIQPPHKHYAIGDGAWVEVTSSPPWSVSDHFEL